MAGERNERPDSLDSLIDWAFPAILIVLGVLYFLVGEYINGSKKKPDKPESPK